MLIVVSAIIALLSILFGATLISPSPASAGSPRDRITIMLTGSTCREMQHPIETALRHIDGVIAVDSTSVPEHLLLDIEEEKTMARDLLDVVRIIVGSDASCRAEIMQSCITAPKLPPTHESAK